MAGLLRIGLLKKHLLVTALVQSLSPLPHKAKHPKGTERGTEGRGKKDDNKIQNRTSHQGPRFARGLNY